MLRCKAPDGWESESVWVWRCLKHSDTNGRHMYNLNVLYNRTLRSGWLWDIAANSTSTILVVTFLFPAVFRRLFYPETVTTIKCQQFTFLPNTDTFKYVRYVSQGYSRAIAISDFHCHTATKTGISQAKTWSFPMPNHVFFLCFNQIRALAQSCHDIK